MKEKFVRFYLEVAHSAAKLSYAKRAQVGAVIVKDGNILAFGYNGTPAGFSNVCEERNKTLPEVLHAETNAFAKIARSTQSSEGATLFTTLQPCLECSKLIIQAGITAVYFQEPYRCDKGLNLLAKSRVKLFQIKEDHIKTINVFDLPYHNAV